MLINKGLERIGALHLVPAVKSLSSYFSDIMPAGT